jgi:hypothetical protein
LAVAAQRLDHGCEAVGSGRTVQRRRARVADLGEPPLAGSGGAEVGHGGDAPVHLDGDLAAVAECGAVDRGYASGAKEDVGQVAAEPSLQVCGNSLRIDVGAPMTLVPAEPGIDVVAADGTEHRPLDPARRFLIHACAAPLRWVHSATNTRS